MAFLFGKAKPYPQDEALYEKLGFKKFETDNSEEIFLGEYKLEDYDRAKVKCWVTCMPPKFYRFEIFTEEYETYTVSTGSGNLIDYWNSIDLIATGMLVLKNQNAK